MNILFTNIGRRSYLVDFLKSNPNFEGKVFVSDCDKTASGLYSLNDGYFLLPKPVDDPELYVKSLIGLCIKKDIKIIIPIIDPEIPILSKYKKEFSRRGIYVLVSNQKVINICNDKHKMNIFLKKNGFDTIITYLDINAFKKDLYARKIHFPVFLKKRKGSGSEKAQRIDNMKKLEAFFEKDMVIQEYVDGTEFGVDIFNDAEGNPIRIAVKEKLAMHSGETDKAITRYDEQITRIAIRLGDKLGHIGPLDCDILKKDNKIYIIDLNPRFGGGYPATHLAGLNLLKLVVQIYLNKSIKPNYHDYLENVIVMKDIGLKIVRAKNY